MNHHCGRFKDLEIPLNLYCINYIDINEYLPTDFGRQTIFAQELKHKIIYFYFGMNRYAGDKG